MAASRLLNDGHTASVYVRGKGFPSLRTATFDTVAFFLHLFLLPMSPPDPSGIVPFKSDPQTSVSTNAAEGSMSFSEALNSTVPDVRGSKALINRF